MAEKLFKKSFMGGYNKKMVDAKIAELETALAENAEQIAQLNAQLEAQSEQIRTMEKERAFISDALLNAKKEGERMLAETNEKIAKLQTEAQEELDRLRALSQEERDLLKAHQKNAKEALAAYKERLDSISI